jgi:nitrite reductase/ring-hydroxylating ferredoxin subunit
LVEIDLGSAAELESLPKEITVRGELYYLIKNENQYMLLSRTCPHAGGVVGVHENIFYCPLHMWAFNSHGDCLNMPGYCLDKVTVEERNGVEFS